MTVTAKINAASLAAIKKLSLVGARLDRINAFYDLRLNHYPAESTLADDHYWAEEHEEFAEFLQRGYNS